VAFGRCGVAPERVFPAFLVIECGRRLDAPPGRSSSLRCRRSTGTNKDGFTIHQ